MSRIRSIKPEMWTSADFLSLSTSGQLMFIWLVSQADDEGRLKSSAPHIERCLGVVDADGQLGVMEARGMAKRYQIGASDYIVLLNFGAHQRIDKPQPSRLPAPIVPKRSHKRRIPVADHSENDPGTVAPRARASDPHGSIDPQGSSTEAADRSRERDRVVAWMESEGFEPDYPNANKLCVSEGWTADEVEAQCIEARRFGPKRVLTYIRSEKNGSSMLSRARVRAEEAAHGKRKAESAKNAPRRKLDAEMASLSDVLQEQFA